MNAQATEGFRWVACELLVDRLEEIDLDPERLHILAEVTGGQLRVIAHEYGHRDRGQIFADHHPVGYMSKEEASRFAQSLARAVTAEYRRRFDQIYHPPTYH